MECLIGTEERVLSCLCYLPRSLAEEIRHFADGRVGGLREIREIRVRRKMRCSILYGSEYIPLRCEVCPSEMDDILYKLCEGSLYAHRDNISSGYIPLPSGVRVGVCGLARYESEGIVGISEASGFVFRIPGHECAFESELLAVWESGIGSGMLIYAPPGIGKTTALRSLAAHIGSGRRPKRVAVVDERCEFIVEDYRGAEVDIMRGYKKRQGIEIAARTLSPEVVIVDEVGGDDASAILGVIRCGVPVVATAHAGSFDELCSKASLSALLDSGVFEVFVGISRIGGAYSLTVNRGLV